MGNNGVSYKFVITNEKLQANYGGTINRYKTGSVNPPTISVQKGMISSSITKWVNPYPDIAFQKITLPQWDGIFKNTTMISNEPDYIKDYHFISLMRCIDFYNTDTFQAIINVNGDSPKIV